MKFEEVKDTRILRTMSALSLLGYEVSCSMVEMGQTEIISDEHLMVLASRYIREGEKRCVIIIKMPRGISDE
jgi:hypothetical protein